MFSTKSYRDHVNRTLLIQDIDQWIEANRPLIHAQGTVVLAPPGAGKSTFVATNRRWVDIDNVLGTTPGLNFHTESWHAKAHTQDETARHYQQCDSYLRILKNRGIWVVGSLFWDYVPDAILIPPEEKHRQWVAARADLEWEKVAEVRGFLLRLAQTNKIKVYSEWKDVQPNH